jgi:protein TonB
MRPANSLISSDDYPIAAARSGVQGKVTVELLIDASGRVSDCSLLQSSGSQDLDGATCTLLTRRAQYYPARNSAGIPVESRVTSSIRWNLPE